MPQANSTTSSPRCTSPERVREHLAVLVGDQLGDLLACGVDQLTEREQHLGSRRDSEACDHSSNASPRRRRSRRRRLAPRAPPRPAVSPVAGLKTGAVPVAVPEVGSPGNPVLDRLHEGCLRGCGGFGEGRWRASLGTGGGGPRSGHHVSRRTTTMSSICAYILSSKWPYGRGCGIGLITSSSMVLDALLAPAMLVGAGAGMLLIARLDQRHFEVIALAFSAFSAFPGRGTGLTPFLGHAESRTHDGQGVSEMIQESWPGRTTPRSSVVRPSTCTSPRRGATVRGIAEDLGPQARCATGSRRTAPARRPPQTGR